MSNRQTSFAKRQREVEQKERAREREQRRAERRQRRQETPAGDGVDPDIADIVPGPQPPSEQPATPRDPTVRGSR